MHPIFSFYSHLTKSLDIFLRLCSRNKLNNYLVDMLEETKMSKQSKKYDHFGDEWILNDGWWFFYLAKGTLNFILFACDKILFYVS